MNQQDEKEGGRGAGGAPEAMATEQIAQLLRRYVASESARHVVPDEDHVRRRDTGPKVEVALCDRGFKSVSTMKTWPEMREAIRRAFEIDERTEARLKYCYTSPLSGRPLLIENDPDWQSALENTRDANQKLIAVQARFKRDTVSPVEIKPDPEPEFVIDLTHDGNPWGWPVSGSRATGGRIYGSSKPRTTRHLLRRREAKNMSEVSTTEDDGDTSSSGYHTSRLEETLSDLSDAADLALMAKHETKAKLPRLVKEPGPEMQVRDLTRTTPDLEEGPGRAVPEIGDAPNPDDINELERGGGGEDESRQNPNPVRDVLEAECGHGPDNSNELERDIGGEDKSQQNPGGPRDEGSEDSPKSVSAKGTEDSGKLAESGGEGNEGGNESAGNSDSAASVEERLTKGPNADATAPTPAQSSPEGLGVELPDEQGVDSVGRVGTSKRRLYRNRCVAEGCQSRDSMVKGHMVPRGEEKRRKWLQAVGSLRTAIKRPWVCGNHFKEEDYRADAGGIRALRRGVIPRPTQKAGLKKGKVKCPECGDSVEGHRIQEHATTVHGYGQRTCPRDDCGFTFEDGNPTTNIHHRMKHWMGRFPCPQCEGVYTTTFALDKHRETAHAAKVTATVSCLIRGCKEREIKPEIRLLRHVKSHQSSFCRVCERQVRGGIAKMVAHQRSKHGVALKPYRCKRCPKTFGTKARKIEHLEKSHGLRHECKRCDSRFIWQSNLIRHERSHHMEKDCGHEKQSVGGTGEPMVGKRAEGKDSAQDQGDGASVDMKLGEGVGPLTPRTPREEVCGCIAAKEEIAPGLAISKGTKIEELSKGLIRRRREVIELLRGRPLTDEEERDNVEVVRLQPVAGYKPSKWTPKMDGRVDRPCIKRQGDGQPTVQAHEGDAAAIYVIPCGNCAEGVWVGAIAVYGILEATEELAARIQRILPMLVKRLPDRISGNSRTRGTEACCNRKSVAFLVNRLLNFGCVVEKRHRRCAKARSGAPFPELPGVKMTSGRTPDGRMENKSIQELASCGRELAYEVGLALKILIPEVYELHTAPTESSCRIDPEDRKGNGRPGDRVGRCFSGGSLLADVATHPHQDRGNKPGTASAMAILRSDPGVEAQHHFIQGYSIAGESVGARAEVIVPLKAGDVFFEDSYQLYHGSTPAADGSDITRLGIAYFLSRHLEKKDHATGTVKRKAGEESGNNVKRSSPRLAGSKPAVAADPAADPAANSADKGQRSPGAKRSKK